MPWGIALNSRHPGPLMKTVHKFLRPCVANTSKEGVLLRYSWHVVAHFERKQGLDTVASRPKSLHLCHLLVHHPVYCIDWAVPMAGGQCPLAPVIGPSWR